MPTIRIEMWSGRTLDQKRVLVKKVTEAVVEALAVQPQEVKIRIVEAEKEDYAVGGVLRSDV
ncbi:MAG: tautomerase family protein [Anaerolineales bacterium]|nr:tautomerase family protein [Anaerolineales bacterium]